MDWVVVSLALFVSSVALYLTVRRSQVIGVSTQLQNLSMFAIPAIFYLILISGTRQSLLVNWETLSAIVFASVFLSYLGNVFSLEGIHLSPNPGYSLMISKSYVILTTLVAVPLFHSELTMKSSLAIALIVVSSALISIPGRSAVSTAGKGLAWLVYSLGAFFCWGGLALVSKYILSRGLNVFVYLFYLTSFVTVLIFVEARLRKVSLTVPRSAVVTVFLIGIFSVFFNLSMQTGYILAPNPGYINAVNASSISLLTLLSVFFFKDEFSFRKFLGVIGSTAGLVLLFL